MLFEETSKILQDFLIRRYSLFSRTAKVVQLFIGNYIWVTYMEGEGKYLK